MNILITGGAGFIGSALTRFMVNKYPESRIIVLDKLTYAGNLENLKPIEHSPNYIFVRGDICDKEKIKDIFERYSLDCVMHLAAESHVDRSIMDPEEFLRTNVFGTWTLLEAARIFWKEKSDKRRVFLNVSTDEVYGSLLEGSFTEDSSYAPNSPYSASKASADHLVRAYNKTYGLPAIITHASNNYGAFQLPEKLIPLMILNALEAKDLPVYGDGGNVRDWLYVEDHVRALNIVLTKGTIGESYNIGADNEWKNIEIVKKICSILDDVKSEARPHSRLIKFVKDRPGHDRRYSIASFKLRNELGWKPIRSFDDGLKETIKWYIENKSWCESVRSGDYLEYYEKNYLRR